jgi:hypothetical protein
VLGVSTNLYQQPGEWQVSLSLRTLESDTHYRLDERQVEREERGTFVINRQHAADITATYAFNRRLSLVPAVHFSCGLPIAVWWSRSAVKGE